MQRKRRVCTDHSYGQESHCRSVLRDLTNRARTLWPLFVKERFGFGSSEYAVLLFASSLCDAGAVALLPAAERALGKVRALLAGAVVAACAVALAFVPPGDWASAWASSLHVGLAAHAAGAVCCFAALAFLGPGLMSLGSLLAGPGAVQGRSFGVLAVLTGLGQIVGNMLGAWAWGGDGDGDGDEGDGDGRSRALPFVLASACLVLGAALPLFMLRRRADVARLLAVRVADAAAGGRGGTAAPEVACEDSSLNVACSVLPRKYDD